MLSPRLLEILRDWWRLSRSRLWLFPGDRPGEPITTRAVHRACRAAQAIGFFAVLHTRGQTLMHHPHLHCVVPGGGLSPDGTRWIACRSTVAKDTLEAVDHLFPENRGEPADEPGGAASMTQRRFRGAIPARRTGYVQRVDVGALMAFARARQTAVRMECRIGEFVIEDTPLASVSEARDADPDAIRQINAASTVDRQRTVDQDAAYGIRQLVDVALKGLSPGINDTTTAIMCVDYLTAILARLAHRQLETPGRGEAGELQVIVRRPTYADFVAEAFDQISQNADGNVAAMRRLIHSLETLSRITPGTERRRVLLPHVEAVREMILRSVQSPRERSELESHATHVSESLKGSS